MSEKKVTLKRVFGDYASSMPYSVKELVRLGQIEAAAKHITRTIQSLQRGRPETMTPYDRAVVLKNYRRAARLLLPYIDEPNAVLLNTLNDKSLVD